MGKKRKHATDSEDDLGTKRIKNESFSEATNGVNNISIDDVDRSKYKVFLIKKPIGVSLADLEALKWSNDEDVLAKTKLKTESGATYRAIVAPNAKKQRMVHIPATKWQEEGDAKEIKAAAFVDGSITILPQEIKHKQLGGSIYEEGEEPEEDAPIHPALKKIKKTAVLELDSRKQRNKAYGTTTDSEGNPRKLIDIIRP